MTRGLDAPRRSGPQIESILSREFTFLLNNWVLLGLLFFILVATTFPLISEALTGEKVTVGPPFYKAWVQPLGLMLLFLMGVGHALRLEEDEPRRPARARSARRSSRSSVAAVLHFAVGQALGFPAVVWSDAIYPGALGAALRAFNAVHAGPRLLALRLQRRGHRPGVRAALPRASARRARADATPAILWWLGGLPGLRPHAVHAAAAVAPPLRRVHRPPRHRAHVPRLHRAVVERRPARRRSSPGRRTTSATTSSTYVGAAHGGRQQQANGLRRRRRLQGRHARGAAPARRSSSTRSSPTRRRPRSRSRHWLRDDVYLIVGRSTRRPSSRRSRSTSTRW